MPDSHNHRWYQFSLRTLFAVTLLTACLLLILRQRGEIRELLSVITAHGLKESAAELTAGEFRVQVRKLSNAMPPAVYEIVIETMGDASVTVANADKTSMSRSFSASPSHGLTRSNVLLVADEFRGQDGKPCCHYLAQTSDSKGNSAGGPGTYHLSQDKPLAELFEIVLEPGVYPRDKPLPMSILDGEVTTLDVH